MAPDDHGYEGEGRPTYAYEGISDVSLQDALLAAADVAHESHPGAEMVAHISVTLGSNPPISVYRVVLTR